MTDGTEAITALHFALMGVLAVLVIIAIAVGIHRQRARAAARREVEEHAAEAGMEAPLSEPEARVAVPAPAVSPIAVQPAPGSPPAVAEPSRTPVDEPIATAVAPDGTTAAMPDGAAPGAPSPADGPVTQLKGLGPKVAGRLAELGIDRVGQLAALDERQAAELDAAMGTFQGRIARDRWIEQARLLAAGDRDGFERVFGKL